MKNNIRIKLGYKAKMKRGEACGNPECYGFIWNKETQELEINEEQAKNVKLIFDWYINGKGVYLIAKELNKRNIPTLKGRKWTHTTVRNVINNDKYVGDLRLQKYYVENPITHKTKVNKGEKDVKKLEDEKNKLNNRLSNLVDMKLDKIIDNDTYVKKEQELLVKIDEVNEKLIKYKSEIINKDKQVKRLNKIEEIINNTHRLEEFNADCFNNMVDKIIIGEIDENGNKNNNVIKFILKTGKNYDFLIDNQKYCMSFRKRNK